jgi:protein disulfide-isomerase A1
VPIYPTLRIFRKGVATIYHGIRTTEAIVDAMHRNTLPVVSSLSSQSDLEDFRKLDHVSVVGYFDDATQSEAKANFTLLAEKVRNKYSFATTSDPKFGELNNVQAPAIAAFKNFDIDTSVDVYNKLFTLEHMEQWLDNNTSPFIAEYGLEVGLSSTKVGTLLSIPSRFITLTL